jgi:hypothetical protein
MTMPLDLHVASSQKKAELKRREMFVDEDLHELVFTKYRVLASGTKYLTRLVDYYGDVSLIGDEVRGLAEDLRLIAAKSAEERLSQHLRDIAAVCERAMAEGNNVYFFGD